MTYCFKDGMYAVMIQNSSTMKIRKNPTVRIFSIARKYISINC